MGLDWIEDTPRDSTSPEANTEVERAVIENIPNISSYANDNQILEPSSTPTSTSFPTYNKDNNTNIQCNICAESFPEQFKLLTHLSIVHGSEYPSECRLCFSRFANETELGYHLNVQHVARAHVDKEKELHNHNYEPNSTSNTLIDSTSSSVPASIKQPPLVLPISLNSGLLGKNAIKAQPKVKNSARQKKNLVKIIAVGAKKKVSSALPLIKTEQSELHCNICSLDFTEYGAWRGHAVYKHIIAKNPYPIVEMNYVDVQTLLRNSRSTNGIGNSAIITTRNQGSKVNEKIKLTFCREKETYTILKKSSSSDDSDAHDSFSNNNNNTQQLTNSAQDFKKLPLSKDNIKRQVTKISFDGQKSAPSAKGRRAVKSSKCNSWPPPHPSNQSPRNTETIPFITSDEIQATAKSIINLNESAYKVELNESIARDENNETSILKQSLISPVKSSSETLPKEIELPGIQAPTIIPSENTSTVKKSPTSGKVVYLGSTSSDNERALANSAGNSHMVIIQNDILRIGEGADVENIQKITAAATKVTQIGACSITTTSVRNNSVDEPKSLLDNNINQNRNSPKHLINSSASHDQPNQQESENKEIQPESILPMTQKDLEENMISQDAQKLNNLSCAEYFEAVSTITSESKNPAGVLAKKKQFITAMRLIDNEVKDKQLNITPEIHQDSSPKPPTPTVMSPTQIMNNALEMSRPNSTDSSTSPRYETITPPAGPADDDREVEEEGENLVIHLPEDTTMEEVTEKETEPISEPDEPSNIRLGDNSDAEDDNDANDTPQNETDDFKCRVCAKIFSSDDELDTHFNATHFRSNSNIFEPESPYPIQTEARTGQNNSSMASYLANSIFENSRALENERHQRNIILEAQRRNSAELPRNLHTNQNAALITNRLTPPPQMRPAVNVPTSFQTHIRQQILRQAPVQNVIRGPSNSAGHLVQAGSIMRPALPSAPVNYSNSYSSSRPILSHQQPPQRPPSQMGPITHSNHPSNANNNPQRINSSQLQHQFIVSQQQQQMNNVNNIVPNVSLQRSLSSGSTSVGRPVPIVRHNSLDQDGPRIVEVSSMGRTMLANEPISQQLFNQQQQQQHNNMLLAQQLQQQQRNIAQASSRIMQQESSSLLRTSNQQQQQQERRIISNPNNQMHSMMRTNEGNGPVQNLLHKRIGGQDIEHSAAKQPRLDNNLVIRSGNQSNQQHHHQNSQIISSRQMQYSDSASSQHRPSPPMSVTTIGLPMDRETINSIGAGGSGTPNIASVRLGNAITLSVCPNSEAQSSVITNRILSSNNSESSNTGLSTIMSTNSVASALAVRGVTVTPASPDHVAAHRNISTNSADHRVSPVIQRTQQSPTSSISPRMYSPPAVVTSAYQPHPLGHQFAIPRGPAPRVVCTTAAVNSMAERPHRPPTVDLTDDEVTHMRDSTANRVIQGQIAAGRGQISPSNSNVINPGVNMTQAQIRPVSGGRQPVSCNQCGVLFASVQALEEHKFSRHGVPQRSAAVPSVISTGNPSRLPQQTGNMLINGRQQVTSSTQLHQAQTAPTQSQAQLRTVSPTRSTQQSNSSRFLYIPLLDLSRLDPSRIRRLEEIGILSMVPLHGNERTGGQMGIPILSLRSDGLNQHMPWDSVLPVGPVHSTSQLAGSNVSNNPQNSAPSRNQMNGQPGGPR